MNEVLWLPDSKMLASGSIPTSEAAGLPLHVVLSDGSIQRSFGSEDASFSRAGSRGKYRLLEPAAGGFIVAPLNRYTVEYWSSELILTRTLRREVSWFTDSAGGAPVGHPDSHRPPPVLRAIWEDANGRIWTNVGVPDDAWRPKANAGSGERPVVRQRTLDELYDTILEILDPATGRVVLSQRVEGVLGSIPGTGLYWRYREDPESGTMIEILRGVLVR